MYLGCLRTFFNNLLASQEELYLAQKIHRHQQASKPIAQMPRHPSSKRAHISQQFQHCQAGTRPREEGGDVQAAGLAIHTLTEQGGDKIDHIPAFRHACPLEPPYRISL